jgi:hypothetical protein
MNGPAISAEFRKRLESITAKRAKTVIDHILEHGFITTEELKDSYGYNHPPRAIGDVRDNGIPIERFRATGKDGRAIAAYRFGDPSTAKADNFQGRSTISKAFKEKLIAKDGSKCAITGQSLEHRYLQVDHRIPYRVSGESSESDRKLEDYMLLSGSANRAKSWSCEQCENFLQLLRPDICERCYWASPEAYEHIAMQDIRRLDIVWSGAEVADYEKLKEESAQAEAELQEYVKDLLHQALTPDGTSG